MYSKTLEEINNKIYDSKFGELPPPGKWPQPGWFGEKCSIIFVGQNPGYGSYIDHQPFEHNRDQNVYLEYVLMSPTGKLIDTALKSAGRTWTDDIAYTNVVKSPTPGNRAPREDEVIYYTRFLFEQFFAVSETLRKVITFGSLASKLFLNEEYQYGIGFYNKKFLWSENPIDILPVQHPSYVLRVGKEIEYINTISEFIGEK